MVTVKKKKIIAKSKTITFYHIVLILRQNICEMIPLFSVYEASFICCFQNQTKLWFSWFLFCFDTFCRFPSHRDKGLVLLWCIFCIIYENRQSRWKLQCFRCFCSEGFCLFLMKFVCFYKSSLWNIQTVLWSLYNW